jgi:hypothetical protein
MGQTEPDNHMRSQLKQCKPLNSCVGAKSLTKIYQIVPLLPPAFSGIGDYAVSLAQQLRNFNHINSEFIVGTPDWQGTEILDGFACHRVGDRTASALTRLINHLDPAPTSLAADPSQTPLQQVPESAQLARADQVTILLHYVGYGYQQRGVPFWLSDWLKQNSSNIAQGKLRLVTMFHEVASSGPPWKSEFWLRPWQLRIAKQVIAASSSIFVSNYISARDIAKYQPKAPVNLYPVWSSFGEPSEGQLHLGDRQPTRWLICGGTTMLERGLTSFLQVIKRIPAEFFPTHLDLIGGKQNPAIAELLAQLQAQNLDISTAYYPQVSIAKASSLFAQATFAWIDYLRPQQFFPSLVFKSTVFASCSAHGVLSVFSHQETGTTIDNEPHLALFILPTMAAIGLLFLPQPICPKSGCKFISGIIVMLALA